MTDRATQIAEDIAESVSAHPVKQIALVVEDLDRAVRNYSRLLDIGPWTGFDLDEDVLQDGSYHGKSASFAIRHALAWKADVQFELVEPVSGLSIFADHLERHGEGLHHIGMYVDDHPRAVSTLVSAGYPVLQSACGFGANGDGAFAYMDTTSDLGTILELISAPAVRRQPSFVYPTPPPGS